MHHPLDNLSFGEPSALKKFFSGILSDRRTLVALIFVFVCILIVSIGLPIYESGLPTKEPATFEECLNQKGSTVQFSYPPTCISKSGITYTKSLTPSETQILTPSPTPPIGWQTYSNDQYGLTLSYPSEWEMLGYRETQMFRDGDLIQFRIVGPTQKEQTEFYDGATVTVAIPQALNGQTYNGFINDYHKPSPETGEKPTIDTRSLNGKTWTHVYVCGLGCFHYYHILYNNLVYGVVTFVGGADERTYTEQVETILSSVSLGITSAHPPTEISWVDAMVAIRNCQVTQVTQTHNLNVYLSLTGGHSVRTKEPALDDVFGIVEEARTKCGDDVIIATE